MACCGTDGLDGFIPNKFNLSHFALDKEMPTPTPAMNGENTYQPFKCIGQSQEWALKCKGKTFAELMKSMDMSSIEYIRKQKEIWGGD